MTCTWLWLYSRLCTHVCTHTQTHARTHTHTHMHMYTQMYRIYARPVLDPHSHTKKYIKWLIRLNPYRQGLQFALNHYHSFLMVVYILCHILLNEWVWGVAVPEHQIFEVMHTITCSFQIVASSRFQFLLRLNVVFWMSHLRWGLGFIFIGLFYFIYLFYFMGGGGGGGGGVWSNLPFSVQYTWTLSTFKTSFDAVTVTVTCQWSVLICICLRLQHTVVVDLTEAGSAAPAVLDTAITTLDTYKTAQCRIVPGFSFLCIGQCKTV